MLHKYQLKRDKLVLSNDLCSVYTYFLSSRHKLEMGKPSDSLFQCVILVLGLVLIHSWMGLSKYPSSADQEDRHGEKASRKHGDASFTRQFTTNTKVYPTKLIYCKQITCWSLRGVHRKLFMGKEKN